MPSSPRSGDGRPGHVVLVGMMGSGKSTVGRLLAARLGRPFIDSDDQVEARTGRTVREIFETDGEPAFRALESAALTDALSDPEASVIAAAGGVVLDPRNRERLRANPGPVVWLRAAAGVLASRLEATGAGDGDVDHRPLLGHDPRSVLTRLLAARHDLYAEVATVTVDVDDDPPAAVVERIVEAVT